MAIIKPTPHVYALREGVRIYRSGDEIRFRKGVWSYNEATVRLTGQPDSVVRFYGAVYEALLCGREVDAAAMGRDVGAAGKEIAAFCELLETLKRQQFLHDAGQRDVVRVVSALLGGNVGGFEDAVEQLRPVLFYADSSSAAAAAKGLAREVGLPLDLLDEGAALALATADLTTRTDAVAHEDTASRLGSLFGPYACVLACVASPNLTLLRNLNRLLIRVEKPLILGLIDGPFLSLLTAHANHAGCFECFEQRQLVRLEDTSVYQRFVESTAARGGAAGRWLAPALHLLTAAAISEAYLYSATGMTRLAGRIVNTYLPLLEIQVQDLLRVPYCPACGFISRAEMNEMYTTTKRLVTELLGKVELED